MNLDKLNKLQHMLNTLDSKTFAHYIKVLAKLDISSDTKATIANLMSDLFVNKIKNHTTSSTMIGFGGSFGTGKTTIARLLAKALYDGKLTWANPIINLVGHKGSETDTKVKTETTVEKAQDGVLYIDGANQLILDDGFSKSKNPFSKQKFSYDGVYPDKYIILDTLKNMSKKYNVLVIFSGNLEPLNELNDSCPIINIKMIDFPNWNRDEITNSVIHILEYSHHNVPESAESLIFEILTGIPNKALANVNGRLARNIANSIIRVRCPRLLSKQNLTMKDIRDISTYDIKAGLQDLDDKYLVPTFPVIPAINDWFINKVQIK